MKSKEKRSRRGTKKKMAKNANFSPRLATKGCLHRRRKINLGVALDRSLGRAGLGIPASFSFTLPTQDLVAFEYNAKLSVSVERNQEPSSSHVARRRGNRYSTVCRAVARNFNSPTCPRKRERERDRA